MPNLFVLLILLLSPQTTPTNPQNWEQIRGTAERQHEIVMLLIRRRNFDRVLQASKEIFSLDFPPSQESLFVEEGRILAEALILHQQYELAQSLLDQALQAVRSNQSKAALYKEKAYLCTKLDKDDEAMEFFEKAMELERSSP